MQAGWQEVDRLKELTDRQREALEAIIRYRAERGYIPSIRDLRRMLGINSLRGVTIHLDALEKKGWIERESTSRSIRILAPDVAGTQWRSVPLLGTIAAGAPLLAVQNIEGYVPIPAEMAPPGKELFALKVSGDSMIGDHILEGDTVIVESRQTAENGQIIAALIGEEATVKRLEMRPGVLRLLPSNPAYDPIEAKGEDVRILGKVVGLIRSYRAA